MDLARLSKIEAKLQKRQKRSLTNLKRKSVHAKKLLAKGKLNASTLRQKSAQILASAGLTGALLLSPITTDTASTSGITQVLTSHKTPDTLKQNLAPITPHYPTKLDGAAAQKIESAITDTTGIPVKAVLEDQSLNHQVGYIGYEQHLKRFPGDDLSLHDDEQIAGIAPGLGAWGYFAPSRDAFTTQDYLREKYYSVAQTLYLPDWNTNFRYLRDWYKYRKILIVNPANGHAVVTVLGDAGPAEFTGKQFGASPEAMKELDLHKGPRKGLVIFLFIDDPDDKIPLGPVTTKINLNQL